MSLMSEICFRLSRRLVLARQPGDAGENPATFDAAAYHDWRVSELRGQFFAHFQPEELSGRDVLDFGCGSGTLSLLAAESGAKSVTGIDLNPTLIEQAKQLCAVRQPCAQPQFIAAANSKQIDLPDNSVDLILCFDVLEHILDYREIIGEWRRVLRTGGQVFIWWVPWLNPYGHHVESLVPIPWAHVFFSERALIGACARIYDLPEFKPRWWDLDESGKKKPNKWQNLTELPELNKLSIGEFEGLCRQSGLHITSREIVGFGRSRLARMTRALTRLPGINELFCSRAIYRLQR